MPANTQATIAPASTVERQDPHDGAQGRADQHPDDEAGEQPPLQTGLEALRGGRSGHRGMGRARPHGGAGGPGRLRRG